MNTELSTSRPKDLYFHLVKALPKGMRDDVMKLYQFVVVANEKALLSAVDPKPYEELVQKWKKAIKTLSKGAMHTGNTEIDQAVRHIAYITHRYSCDITWVDTYLQAIELDAAGIVFATEEEQLDYMGRTSEMIGCIAAKIIGIQDHYMAEVRAQSRAFQQLQFIRNCGEDSLNGRVYFAKNDLIMCGLKILDEIESQKKPAAFREFIELQVGRYHLWRMEARVLSRHIPLKARGVLRMALDSHNWIARSIESEPSQVFTKKVTPNKVRMAYIRATRKVSF